MTDVSEDPPADFSSFAGICDWFDTFALAKIRKEFDEDFSTFGIAFISIEDGNLLPEVCPVPVIADSDLSDKDYQQDFADQLRQVLKRDAATGVAMIVYVHGDDDDPCDAVIVALEHKGGRAAWMAETEEDGLGPFARDDQINWQPGHAFADLLPVRAIN